MKSLFFLAAAPLLTAACQAPSQRELGMSDKEIIPARDGDIAIQEEYEAARRAGTVSAYDLFIARHPRHPLAHRARAERSKFTR